MLPPPPPQPATEKTTPFQPESLALGAFASALAPTDIPSLSVPTPTSVGVKSSSPIGIQCLALTLNRAPSLLDDPSLSLLLIRSTLRPADHRHLNAVETDELFANAIHSVLESVFYIYVAHERFKALS